jgi:hypothetical protein
MLLVGDELLNDLPLDFEHVLQASASNITP